MTAANLFNKDASSALTMPRMPKLETVRDASGGITDVVISYPQDLTKQMLEYADATRALRR